MKQKELQKVKDQVNKVGCGFCVPKWYNSTIWLSNGRTASCLIEAHYIPREVFKNPKRCTTQNLKNNVEKKCWKINVLKNAHTVGQLKMLIPMQ